MPHEVPFHSTSPPPHTHLPKAKRLPTLLTTNAKWSQHLGPGPLVLEQCLRAQLRCADHFAKDALRSLKRHSNVTQRTLEGHSKNTQMAKAVTRLNQFIAQPPGCGQARQGVGPVGTFCAKYCGHVVAARTLCRLQGKASVALRRRTAVGAAPFAIRSVQSTTSALLPSEDCHTNPCDSLMPRTLAMPPGCGHMRMFCLKYCSRADCVR